MTRITKLIAACAVTLAAAGLALADDNKSNNNKLILIKGKVIGEDGKPQPDAEIRVMRAGGKDSIATTTTDARGTYMVTLLPMGAYTVSAYVDTYERSRAHVKVFKKGWAKVDFDLRLDLNNFADHFDQDLRADGSPTSHGGHVSQ